MKKERYLVLEYQDRSKYEVDMYKILQGNGKDYRYLYTLNTEEYREFILDKNIGDISLYTSIL